MNLFSLPETRDLLWSNNGSGTFPVNLLASIDSWGNCSIEPAAFPAPSFGAFNDSEGLWTSQQSSEIPEMSSDCLETESMVYARSCMRDDLLYYPEDAQTTQTDLDLSALDFPRVSKPIGLWNQPSELNNDMSLTSGRFSGVRSSYLPTGTGFWMHPDQPLTRTPPLQLCPTGVDLLNSCDIPRPNIFLNQDIQLHGDLLHGTTIQAEDHIAESKASENRFVQSQPLDSFRDDSTPSPMSGKCSETASDNATTPLVHNSKHPSRLESVLSAQFENDTLQNGLAQDYSSLQTHVAPNQEILDNSLSECGEETNDVKYDTCFGIVSLLNSNSTTQEYCN